MMMAASALGPLAHEASLEAVDLDTHSHEDGAVALGDIDRLSDRIAAALTDIR